MGIYRAWTITTSSGRDLSRAELKLWRLKRGPHYATMDNNNWDMHAHQHQSRQHPQQQHTYQQRSQSMSIPASQFSGSAHYSTPGDYSQQHNYDRRHPSAYQTPIPPLQVNPSSFAHSDVPPNLPSSSLPGAQPQQQPLLTRSDRHRTQSVALTSIGQREQGYASSSGYPRMAHRSNTTYGSEATVPISRHTHAGGAAAAGRSWAYQNEPLPPPVEPQVPYISSAMSQYQHQPMGVPSRQMPPLSELDRRPVSEEAPQPRPKPHVCDQCGAAFSRAHDLKRHIETHKGDRPHKCPTCTKAFSRKDALQRHQSMAQCGVDPQEMYQ
ncbi:DNA-binding protein creA OS=Aspergillus oryzae (strain ATCC 42149 / RIB 40) GN=creA PE=3 SV=1 [Rhizoctonia solani AG-1 IB]|uniref:DNA-binding protein creA n=1 Tax=Thanatephorus cucumeris (strain AG1-IB / isolate 7/3/14) TaxID=1108050 RepID=A0A0B7F8J5_THACB|nr:DNA-binding protein creA OS=Aspergillus oryzae (strain ATCC 42149 / RIB 40) GN=creA PE=3 SV=1 [Rhizoctonia solani AG-1 IB]